MNETKVPVTSDVVRDRVWRCREERELRKDGEPVIR
jgi:hypothetical protein